jgi:uncharacterized membrane protein YeiB
MGLQQISKPSRDEALDVLRGLALAGMLLVNNPGSWSHVFFSAAACYLARTDTY